MEQPHVGTLTDWFHRSVPFRSVGRTSTFIPSTFVATVATRTSGPPYDHPGSRAKYDLRNTGRQPFGRPLATHPASMASSAFEMP